MAESGELIIPPKKVYAIIEKTAQHVASKGDAFEEKIRASGNNKKFGFLEPENPYYAFYKEAVRLFRAGETGTCRTWAWLRARMRAASCLLLLSDCVYAGKFACVEACQLPPRLTRPRLLCYPPHRAAHCSAGTGCRDQARHIHGSAEHGPGYF